MKKKKSFRKLYKKRIIKPFYQKRGFLISGLILLFFSFLGYLFFLSPLFQATEIVVLGNQLISDEVIKANLQENLFFNLLFLELRTLFSIKKSEAIIKIKEEFPEISSVRIERNFPNKIIVNLRERSPVAIWCQGESCFLIDQEGVIFQKSSSLNMVVIQSENNDFNLGQRVIAQEEMAKIIKIGRSLKEIGLVSFNLEGEKLKVQTAEGWQVFFTTRKDISEQIINLFLILNKQISAERRKQLNYIDLRFYNQAIFK